MQITEDHQELRLLIAVVQAQDAESATAALQN